MEEMEDLIQKEIEKEETAAHIAQKEAEEDAELAKVGRLLDENGELKNKYDSTFPQKYQQIRLSVQFDQDDERPLEEDAEPMQEEENPDHAGTDHSSENENIDPSESDKIHEKEEGNCTQEDEDVQEDVEKGMEASETSDVEIEGEDLLSSDEDLDEVIKDHAITTYRQEVDVKPLKTLTSKEKRRIERNMRPKKAGVHFYDTVDVKNKRGSNQVKTKPSKPYKRPRHK